MLSGIIFYCPVNPRQGPLVYAIEQGVQGNGRHLVRAFRFAIIYNSAGQNLYIALLLICHHPSQFSEVQQFHTFCHLFLQKPKLELC